MPRYTQHKKTKRYTNEFKYKAVQLSLIKNIQVQDVAKALGIHPFMLSRWRKEVREGVILSDKRFKSKQLKQEKKKMDKLKRLEQENARLRQENELLKKWQRFLAEESGNDLDSSTDTEPNSE